jgi:CubicO group peptidase (beta-lactamase class C family)
MSKSLFPAIRICMGLAFAICAFQVHAAEIFPGKQWEKAASPDQAGWSAGKLKDADDFVRSLPVEAYLIVHRGVIIHEYGAIARASSIQSMRKSMLSVLMGMHADRGEVNLDKTLVELSIDDKEKLSAAEKQATVRHLLQGRSGIYHPAAAEPPPMQASRPPRGSYLPGEHWNYNNWGFNALGEIFKRFTGKTVLESLRDDLAGPLQFEDFNFSSDAGFIYEKASDYPAYNMRLSARDLARVGLLMARDGRWKERRLVSEKWIAESTASYSDAGPGLGYGYMWWVGLGGAHYGSPFPGKVFSATGVNGQRMVIDPVRDLVIVYKVNSEQDRSINAGRQFGQLLRHIMDAKLPEPAKPLP